MAEQTDLLRIYEEDGQRFVEMYQGDQTAKFLLVGEPQFDSETEFVRSLSGRSFPVHTSWTVSFDMAEYIPPPPKPKRTWSRAMGLRKPA